MPVFTPTFRASYVNIFEPRMNEMNNKPEYSICMLIPKTADLKELQQEAFAAGKKKWGAEFESLVKSGKIRMPFRDGDKEKADRAEYEGHYFINAKAYEQVGVVDGKKNRIHDASELYSGCYAKAYVTMFAYDTKGNKGISVVVKAIQKVAEGEALGNVVKAENVFDNIVEDESTADADLDAMLG